MIGAESEGPSSGAVAGALVSVQLHLKGASNRIVFLVGDLSCGESCVSVFVPKLKECCKLHTGRSVVGRGELEQKETKVTKYLGWASAFFGTRTHVEKILNGDDREAPWKNCLVW